MTRQLSLAFALLAIAVGGPAGAEAELLAVDLVVPSLDGQVLDHRNDVPAVRPPPRPFSIAGDGAPRRGPARCGTRSPTPAEKAQVEREIAPYLESVGGLAHGEAAPVNTIEIVLWNVYLGAEGKLTEAQLAEQLAVLNRAFSNFRLRFEYLNDSYFTVNAASRPGLFDLEIDSDDEAFLKEHYQEDPFRYLNVYTVNSLDALGWAAYPWWLAREPELDGVVLAYDSFPGSAASPYNLGDTAVHEIGHWLGLYHTFEGGCGKKGDWVDDTPAEKSPAYDCPVGRNTCPSAGLDPIRNFMDYVDDACMNQFSGGQRSRVKAQVARYRSQI